MWKKSSLLAATLCGDKYNFKGAICLVDAVNFFDQLDDLETVYRQLKHCHLAVLTKVDLVDGQRIMELKEKIREINPVCRIDVSSNGNLDLSFLNEDLMQYRWAEGEETTNSEETKPKTLFLNFEGEVELENWSTSCRLWKLTSIVQRASSISPAKAGIRSIWLENVWM